MKERQIIEKIRRLGIKITTAQDLYFFCLFVGFFLNPVLKLCLLVPYSPYPKGNRIQSRLQLSHAYKRIFDVR